MSQMQLARRRLNLSRADALTAIRRLGLSGNMRLCFDAGAESSYLSGQKWLDMSGNGYDFFLGTTSGSDATDPTFNGTAGRRSASEYWSSDGGDCFTYDSANETWMNSLHKDTTSMSGLAWVYPTATNTLALLGTTAAGGFGGIGIYWRINPSSTGAELRITANKNAAGAAYNYDSAATITLNKWAMVGFSYNTTTKLAINLINGVSTSATLSPSSPSSAAADGVMQIGAIGGSGAPLPASSRIASLAFWEGRALTAAEMLAYYQATRAKFSI